VRQKFINRYPLTAYFIIAFFLSWVSAFMLVLPKLLNGRPITKMDGLLMFPIMILGPALTGIILTGITEGKKGIRNLFARVFKWKVSFKWYALAFCVPPIMILLTLFLLMNFVSITYTPNFFFIGILFGIPAGFFEEIGWTGFALYKSSPTQTTFIKGLLIGIFWGLWHLPVIDFLGAASPHGDYLMLLFISFCVIMTAMRLLMVWVYSFTNSVLIAQLMHAVSTGCLVMLGPPNLMPFQEATWYALYGVMLWILVLLIYNFYNKTKGNTATGY
jgi:membrane protease YdiL (CAAX protease family)